MAEFDVQAGCLEIEIDASLDDLSITFPGPFILSIPAPPGIDISAALDYAKQIIASLNAAIAPLTPIFNIIDLLLLLVEFAKAIPDAIISLDPGKLTATIPKLSAKLDKLLAMLPPISIPIFIKAILKVVITFLLGIRAALEAIIAALLEAGAARARAAFVLQFSLEASLGLGAAGDCAEATANANLAGLAQGTAPLNSLLRVIQLFCDLAGLDVVVPTLTSLGEDAGVALVAIDALIVTMTNLSAAIVV